MTKLPAIERRTALKTIGAGIVGSATLTGSVKAAGGRGRGPKNVVEIEAKHPDDGGDHYIFEFSRTEIERGWTTFVLENQSSSTHLAPTFRYTPETVDTIDTIIDDEDNDIDSRREAQIEIIAQPFQAAWNDYWRGESNLEEFFGDLEDAIGAAMMEAWPEDEDPEDLVWDSVPVGGLGLIQGEHTARTTMYLEPGVHYMECYVLDDKGRFHTDHMIESFVVTENESKAVEPTADVDVAISSGAGIGLHGSIDRPGRYRIGVTFEDNTPYGHLMGHDVNLIQLDGATHIDGDGGPEMDVNIWVNWLDQVLKEGGDPEDLSDYEYGKRGALTSTSADPGPGTWLGGVQDIFPNGAHQTAYFEASLKPGDYALVAEIPDPLGQGFVEEFSVGQPGGRGR